MGRVAQGASETFGEPSPTHTSSLCCSWGSARPLQRDHVGEEGPPLQPGEDATQSFGLQRPTDEEREAEGGSKGQETDLIKEGECVALKLGTRKPMVTSFNLEISGFHFLEDVFMVL